MDNMQFVNTTEAASFPEPNTIIDYHYHQQWCRDMDIFADPKSPEMLDQSLQGFLSNGDTTVLSYAAVSLIDSFPAASGWHQNCK